MAQVVLENIYKSFPQRQKRTQTAGVIEPASDPATVSVLRRINLTVHDGEFMVLVGPSGCGKSTLLRLIAGLETLTGGNIWVGERLVNDLPPKQRDIAMVFQSYALYPHMTVYENLAFGLRRRPPTFMLLSPSSQPLITRPFPIGNSNGWPRSRELSNLRPSSSVPV
ncbi:ABC transporter ATP-binding protein [Leptolyngbya sp. 7M]|nr:ABC transporter ATP-binding protein [Leptolyngbya sp. 7M]